MRPFGVKVSLIEPGFHKTNITNTENLKKSLYASFEQAPKYVQDEYGKEFLEQGVYAFHTVTKYLCVRMCVCVL